MAYAIPMKHNRQIPPHIALLIHRYRTNFAMLAVSDDDAFNVTQSLWAEWQKQGTAPPDIANIAHGLEVSESGFFYDIVATAELMEAQPLNIFYCHAVLDAYNFYAISSNGGYIVLVDDVFFQLLFFLCIILIFDAQGQIKEDEEDEVVAFVNEVIETNYFNKKQYDFSKAKIVHELLKHDYELAEFANYFFQAMKTFIISHEIAHHVLKHTTGTMQKEFGFGKSSVSLKVDSRRIGYEYEADDYGYRLFKKVSDTIDGSLEYAGCLYKFYFAPIFLFDLFLRLDKLQEHTSGSQIIYDTHPHPVQRSIQLANAYNIDTSDPLYRYLTESLNKLIVLK